MSYLVNSFDSLEKNKDLQFPLAASIHQLEPCWDELLTKGELKIEQLTSDLEVLNAVFDSDRKDWRFFARAGICIIKVDEGFYKCFLGKGTDLLAQFIQRRKKDYESPNDKSKLPKETGSA